MKMATGTLEQKCGRLSLFLGRGEENREAFFLMRQFERKYKVDVAYSYGSIEEGTPILLNDCEKIQGLREIQEFIEDYCNPQT